MKRYKLYIVLSRVLLLVSGMLLTACVASCLGFDGVVVRNLNADLGEIHRGKEMIQVVHIVNYRLHPVTVLFVPTCGCMSTDRGDQVLNAFRSVDIPFTFRLDPKINGQVKRDVSVVYMDGDQVRRVAGETHFTVVP